MKGYWNDVEATQSSIENGWIKTGDLATIDNEGFCRIVGRKKDMVIRGGENIYPAELEEFLTAQKGILEAHVFGVPDEKYGEVVKACIVKKEGSNVTEADLISFCKDRIASYKKPQSVDFIDEVPRNASGKVLKKVLREPYWKDQERQVS